MTSEVGDESRSRHLRDRQERPVQDRRGDARGARQDGVLAGSLDPAGDYSCGVFDANGDMVAQGPDLPIHLGSMPDAVRAVVKAFAADVHQGERLHHHNDTLAFGGSHLPDVNVVAGRRSMTAACSGYAVPARALASETSSSATPGSIRRGDARSSAKACACRRWRLISRGTVNADLERLILANVRTPDERKGDLGDQLAATLRATERLAALAARHGADVLIGYMAQVMDYSERLMRAALADLPDGEGSFEDHCDGDGIADDADGNDCSSSAIRLTVCCKRGDRLVADFAPVPTHRSPAR